MKAVVIQQYGGRDQLRLRDVPQPALGKREVLVRVRATSVNPLDWKMRTGQLRLVRPAQFPLILGFDVAGEVEAVGAEVARWKRGDRVFAALRRGGGYAEYASVHETMLAPVPGILSFEEAAAMPLAALTAFQALHGKARIETNQQVLINGAAGGVGSFSVQLAVAAGCCVTAVTSTRNIAFMRQLGAEKTIDYTQSADFAVHGSYDVLFDVVGNLTYRHATRLLRPSGTYITTRPSAAAVLRITAAYMSQVFGARQRHSWILYEPNGRDLEVIGRLVVENKVRPIVHEVHELHDIAEAHRRSEAGHVRGKIAIHV